MAKVVRVLVYEGPPEKLRQTLGRGIAINGAAFFGEIKISSVITTVENASCLKCGSRTDDKTLICGVCQFEAEMEVPNGL